MTITTNPSRDEYTSSPGQTVFNYTFKIYENTDLNVYVTPEGQEANDATDIVTNYTVDSNTIGNDAGGFITFDSPLNDGDLVTIVSDIPTDRTTDYQANGDFIPQTVNNDFDRTVSLVKQVENLATRTIQFQESQQSATGITLPAPNPGDILQWNDAGDGFENTDGSGILGIDQAVADAEAARDASEGFADDSATSAASSFDSATDSSDSALLSQAWAESATEPGDPGTKSSKTWADESAASAQEAADEVASIDKVYLKSGRKNYIINGNFGIWQRGSSAFSAGYTADRWAMEAAGSDLTVNKTSVSPSGDGWSGYPKYVADLRKTTPFPSGVAMFSQPIESPRDLINEDITISFELKTSGLSGLLFFDLEGVFNETYVGIFPSLVVTDTGGLVEKHSFTVPATDITGGNPISDTDRLRFRMVGDGTTSFTFIQVCNIQVEKGSYATEFEYRPIAEELALCQRYAWQSDVRESGSKSNDYTFPTTMRVTPTLTSAANVTAWSAGSFRVTAGANQTVAVLADAEL